MRRYLAIIASYPQCPKTPPVINPFYIDDTATVEYIRNKN
jgi:hypothetical protein